jgi:PAS domain S-box-containing protein
MRFTAGVAITEDELLEALGQNVAGLTIDENGVICRATAELEELFGYRFRGELIGEEVEILMPEEFRAAHKQHTKAFFANPHKRPMTGFEGQTKQGLRFPCTIKLGAYCFAGRNGLKVATAIVAENAKSILPPPASATITKAPQDAG